MDWISDNKKWAIEKEDFSLLNSPFFTGKKFKIYKLFVGKYNTNYEYFSQAILEFGELKILQNIPRYVREQLLLMP